MRALLTQVAEGSDNHVKSEDQNLGHLMHYAAANILTLSCVDPHSRQPSYKHCAATLEAVKD